jgi:hypothetical protein
MKNETKQNFDVPAGQTIEEMIASAVAKAEARIKAQGLKGQTNAIQLGATVKDLDFREGSEIVDKTTGEVRVDSISGEAKRYPTKYYVTLVFKGGSIKQEIKANHFDFLEINKDYFCTGFLGEVSTFGKTEIHPIFTEFELLGV